LSVEWYPRAVLFVADIDRTLDFYVNRLGFTEAWHFGDEGTPHVAEADRQGCALIFSTESPDKAGKGLIFISLNVDMPGDQIPAEIEALDRLRVELEGRGVDVEEGFWGHRVLIVHDLETSSISPTRMSRKKHRQPLKRNESGKVGLIVEILF
jgi:catechol 2,3-dioxygenase-like lactoylglutathione lyase family enzyme